MKQFICVLVVGMSMGLLTPLAQAAQTPDLARTGQRIEQAYYGNDAAVLLKLSSSLERAVEQTPKPGKYLYYYLGYADYALGGVYAAGNTHDANGYLEQAVAALTQALHRDPNFAEALALLGSSYGKEIYLHPFKGMFLGPKAGNAIDHAMQLAPANPRVVMFKGVADYYTPSYFGGNKPRAEQEFRRAIGLFASYTPSDATAPTWGKAEAYFMLAQAEAAAGETQQARSDYHAALTLEPGFADAKAALGKLAATKSVP